MEKRRVLIAESSGEFARQIVEHMGDELELLTVQDGQEAMRQLVSFQPEILVLDLLLPGMDGISLLQQAGREQCCPAVLATTRLLSSYMAHWLDIFGVEYVMVKPCEASVVAERIKDLARQLKMPVLTGPDRRTLISNLLMDLGVPTKLKGYLYLREAIARFSANPMQAITKELYTVVGGRCGATYIQVERALRTAIETAWLNGDRQIWRRYFVGNTRPTNGAFISRLAQHILTIQTDGGGE